MFVLRTESNVAIAEDDSEDNIGIENETGEEINHLADYEIPEESLPLNVHLPTTSPSTNRNMPRYYQPYITVPNTSFVSTLTPSTFTNRDNNMQPTLHTLSSAPTPESPVSQIDTTVQNPELVNPFYNNYHSGNTN